MRYIGITTTVPSEVIWAAGMVPVDLNNLFIASESRNDFIRTAEREGYPRNVCAWIKGMYGTLVTNGGIDTVIAVTQGDCSNTHALMETLQLAGIETIPFAFPYDRDYRKLADEIKTLAQRLGTTVDAAEKQLERLDAVRCSLDQLDLMTWREQTVSGTENHQWLVSSSDFYGDVESFSEKLSCFIDEAANREPITDPVRLGYIGVPPIFDDLHEAVAETGGHIVFNEVQRQFSQPDRSGDLVERYLAYTYPYDIFHRLAYIRSECRKRTVHGIIHYVQSFCHRHIEDLIVRKTLDVPVLTIEGENPGVVDERTKIRIQAFVEMLEADDTLYESSVQEPEGE